MKAAASYDEESISNMELLFENGADINHQDKTGHTALYYAVLHGRTETVKWLLENGADALVEDKVS